jgi:DNA-binding IclR family transcriptional regulator
VQKFVEVSLSIDPPASSSTVSRNKPRQETSSDKMLSIMDLFTPQRPEWTIEEMVAQVGLSHSTVYRYVRSLVSVGLVFSARPGRYLLGPGIIQYDRQFRLADPMIHIAQPMLRSLAGEMEPPGVLFIARLYRGHVMSMLEQNIGLAEFACSYDRGQLMPMYRGAPSLVILAHSPIRNIKRPFLSAHRTSSDPIAEWRQFRRQLRTTRTRGYAADIGEIDPYAMYLSVPLLRRDGGVAASLTLGAPKERAAASIDVVATRLRLTSQQIGERLLEEAQL